MSLVDVETVALILLPATLPTARTTVSGLGSAWTSEDGTAVPRQTTARMSEWVGKSALRCEQDVRRKVRIFGAPFLSQY